MGLKLEQGQVWKHGKEFVRIVHLARLEVGYKVMKDLKSGEGTHHHTSKKDFCRLLKSCTLLGAKKDKDTSPPVEEVDKKITSEWRTRAENFTEGNEANEEVNHRPGDGRGL